MKPNKPEDMIVNSPLITGRTDSISTKMSSPMGSPMLASGAGGSLMAQSKNISDIHKKVLLKNFTQQPKREEDDVSDELSPVDANIKNMKKEIKPFRPSIDAGKGNYVASPLGKKPRGSVDTKVVGNSPIKTGNAANTSEVKTNLKNMEEKR